MLSQAGHGQYCPPQTHEMESSKLRSSLRSTLAMSIENTSKDYFITVHNEYNYLSILTDGQKPVHARAQIRHCCLISTTAKPCYEHICRMLN